jgi:hypothetical protein
MSFRRTQVYGPLVAGGKPWHSAKNKVDGFRRRNDRTDHVCRDRIPGGGLARHRRHSARAHTRGATDAAPNRSLDAALDGGNPGRQGPVARRVRRLKLELGEKTAALFALEREAAQRRVPKDETAGKGTALETTERTLAATQAELAQIKANYSEASVTTDSQRVELVALRAQVEVLRGQIESYEKEIKDLQARLSRQSQRGTVT